MKKIYPIILLTLLIMSSCFYWGMTHMNKDDLAWMAPYQIGDTSIYLSANKQDTLIVINKEIWNSCNPINNESIGATYEAGGFIEYKKIYSCRIH